MREPLGGAVHAAKERVMRLTIHHLNRSLAIAAGGMAVASVLLKDADKSPLYLLLAYLLWRLR